MNTDSIREFCLSLPHVTENVPWGADLVFKIAGKMFVVVGLETLPQQFSFKCTPEEFAELVEIDGIAPAQYVARYHWVTVSRADALSVAETRRLIRQSYDLVWGKLPRKIREGLGR